MARNAVTAKDYAALAARGLVPAGAKRQRKEGAFQQAVVDFAHLCGWRVASFRAVRVQRRTGEVYYETPVGADGKGWPDIALTKPGRFIVAELKIPPNTTTPEQVEWLRAFEAAGVPAFVWGPADWPEIETVLRD